VIHQVSMHVPRQNTEAPPSLWALSVNKANGVVLVIGTTENIATAVN
jgi:hypothetical protein